MGGGESGKTYVNGADENGYSQDGYARTTGYDPNLDSIDEFMKSEDAKGVNVADLHNISKQEFYSHDDQKRLLGTNYGTNSSVDRYNAWKANRDKGNADHETYLNAVKAAPGRSATLLVPATQGNDPSILTGNTKRPKSVLT